LLAHKESQNNSVSIVKATDMIGVDFPASTIHFSFAFVIGLGPLTTQPHIQCVQGALFSAVKRSEREDDNLPPSSAEIKSSWRCTFTLPHVFMALCLSRWT